MVMDVLGSDISTEQAKNVIDGEGILEKKKMIDKADGLEKSELLNGSSGLNEGMKEGDHVTDSSIPKDALDDWPAEKQLHTFYFIRYRTYEDPKLKAKIEHADKEVQRKTQARTQITEALRAKRSEKADLISQLKPLQEEEKQFRVVMDGKRKEMEPLQAALGKLRGTRNSATEKGVGLCSSEEELNEAIQSLQYQIQHESNTLAVEKQLLKEIKQLEASREKVIANAAMRTKIQESFGQKDAIQGQVKLIGSDLDGARKEQQSIRSKIQHLEEKLNVVRAELDSLQKELVDVTENRDKAYQTLTMLRKDRDELNACFFQYRSLMNNIKHLAANKEIATIEELSLNEVEKFMSQWNSSKAFRDDYERRMLSSLDMRQLSRDGRMRNPDEKPILSVAPVSIEVERGPSKASGRKEKEGIVPAGDEAVPNGKVQEQVAVKPAVEAQKKAPDTENASAAEESPKDPPKSDDIDPTKLKEMKREEEIAKAKLATERKKKLAEKAAAKAAIRSQKEAEKKQKEKEKKARKKAGALVPPGDAEQQETETRDAEPEPQEETNEHTEAPASEKSRELPKDKSIRLRSRAKGQSQIPKVLLKKKKAHSYWLWAAPAAICALILAISGYYYSLWRSQ